jgi:hypothetical protein
MKILEIIVEGDLRKGTQLSLPNIEIYPELTNSNPYHAYRFGLQLAASPDNTIDKEGPIGTDFLTIGYSSADQKIIDDAKKRFGLNNSKKLGGKFSKELTNTNTVSPVANLGPVKRKSK